jgi:hypothetical protein
MAGLHGHGVQCHIHRTTVTVEGWRLSCFWPHCSLHPATAKFLNILRMSQVGEQVNWLTNL